MAGVGDGTVGTTLGIMAVGRGIIRTGIIHGIPVLDGGHRGLGAHTPTAVFMVRVVPPCPGVQLPWSMEVIPCGAIACVARRLRALPAAWWVPVRQLPAATRRLVRAPRASTPPPAARGLIPVHQATRRSIAPAPPAAQVLLTAQVRPPVPSTEAPAPRRVARMT